MAKTSSVIEINGNRYDAVTGQMLGTVKNIATQVKKAPIGVIDGFTNTFYTPAKNEHDHKSAYKTKEADKRLRQSVNYNQRQAERSHTLMRSAVLKPQHKNSDADSIKQDLYHQNTESRTKSVLKHAKVNRFGAPKAGAKTIDGQVHTRHGKSGQPNNTSQKALTRVAAVPNSAANISSQQLERLLDYALVKADAHKNNRAAHKRTGLIGKFMSTPKLVRFGSAALIVILLGGFFAWQNVPQVSMKVAAVRASIPADVPGYTPSGFKFTGPISYNNGKVSINFIANGDNSRRFTISQQKSNWTSATLAANLIPQDAHMQMSQVKGTTVYIYGQENHAAWVDKGVRYILFDNASLNSDQILKIAESM